MAVFTELITAFAVMIPLLAEPALAGSIADIEHVFSSCKVRASSPTDLSLTTSTENRSFDHYLGTMAGVRGFSDPNVQANFGDTPVWEQVIDPSITDANFLLPWYLNYQGGSFLNATQCMVAGDNGWQDNHAALNGGLNNHWATNNTPWSWGHFQRSDIPVQFAIAEAWTVGDMYQESVIASTNPNRVTWLSGSINVPGSPQTESEGGYPYIDNNETPGCETGGFDCYPLSWKTTPEFYEDAGVSWSIFQNADNFDDNPLAWFAQFQDAPAGSDLRNRGFVGSTLDDFYTLAANGSLPAVSYVVAPTELSEHPPYSPRDGAWLQKQVIDAVTQGAGYNTSVVIISYDETGGWGDHVVPYHSPNGTAGEWLNDPYNLVGYTYSGPGFRLPFYIISPWTRNGGVFTEYADHNSQILFIEEWLAAKGKNVTTNQMVPWRRQHMSSLVNAFDFANPNYSLPSLPDAPAPHTNSEGVYDGAAYCESLYPATRPTVPYTNQTTNLASLSENGFKQMRGALTEGRFVVFEMNGYALTNAGGSSTDFSATPATANHSSQSQQWVMNSLSSGGNTFTASSAVDGKYISSDIPGANETDGLMVFTVAFQAGSGYALQQENGTYVAIDECGNVGSVDIISYFSAFSVTYS